MASSTDNGFFGVVGSSPTSTIINFFRLSPSMANLKTTLPSIPRKWNKILTGPPVYYPAGLLSRRFRGKEECYRACSLGMKLLVKLSQVVKRTNTPLISLTLRQRRWCTPTIVVVFFKYYPSIRELKTCPSQNPTWVSKKKSCYTTPVGWKIPWGPRGTQREDSCQGNGQFPTIFGLRGSPIQARNHFRRKVIKNIVGGGGYPHFHSWIFEPLARTTLRAPHGKWEFIKRCFRRSVAYRSTAAFHMYVAKFSSTRMLQTAHVNSWATRANDPAEPLRKKWPQKWLPQPVALVLVGKIHTSSFFFFSRKATSRSSISVDD